MVQEVKAYKTIDGQVFDQRDGAIRHELVHLFDEGLKNNGYMDTRGGAGDAFFDILTENDSRITALLKMYRDCHPKVRGEAPESPQREPVSVLASPSPDAAGPTVWRRVENQILTPRTRAGAVSPPPAAVQGRPSATALS